jgi:hypothetical protein
MTMPDISADFPEFKKNLKRLKKLQKTTDYLRGDILKKSTTGVDLLNKSRMILQKAEDAQQRDLDFYLPETGPEEPEPLPSSKILEEKPKVLAPKFKQLADTARRDTSFTIPSVSPTENYAAQKYSRLQENYATGIGHEISESDRRIKELAASQKEGWEDEASGEFGRWVAVEQFKLNLRKLGINGALEWLADSMDEAKKDKLNVYEYLETEEAGEFNEDFRNSLAEKDFYKDGYINSVNNLYRNLYPQLYNAFVEEEGDETINPENRIIVNALKDLPDFENEDLGKRILKQSISSQIYGRYGMENSKNLANKLDKYIDDNYNSLKLKGYRTKSTDTERLELLKEIEGSDTIHELMRLQGFRRGETNKLSINNIEERDYPKYINKLVAELKINPRFKKYWGIADTTVARLFGPEFENSYRTDLVDAYLGANPHYINYLFRHTNALIDAYNEGTPKNIRRIPHLRLHGKPGEIVPDDVERLQLFFKKHGDGDRLVEFLEEKGIPKTNRSYEQLQKLTEINDGGGLSYLSNGDSNAALFLENILTENRGETEQERIMQEKYFRPGIAYIIDPRTEDSRLYVKEFLNSPVFMNPKFLSNALRVARNNPKGSGDFVTLVEEIMPLVTGGYYKRRSGKSNEELAREDYLDNPFVKRLQYASKSPGNFMQFMKFINSALSDIGADKNLRLSQKALFSEELEDFIKRSDENAIFDKRALEFNPVLNKTPFELAYFKTPDEHIEAMNTLKKLGWRSNDEYIADSVGTFAGPVVYDGFFANFANLFEQKRTGQNVENAYASIRQSLLNTLNNKFADYLFEQNSNLPYNYFSKVYDIKNQKVQNGVLEAAYILKRFDKDFYGRLLKAKSDENGIINPDTQPRLVEPEPEVRTEETVLPVVPKEKVPETVVEEAVQPRLPTIEESIQERTEPILEPTITPTEEPIISAHVPNEELINIKRPLGETEELEEPTSIDTGPKPYERRDPKKRIYSLTDSNFAPGFVPGITRNKIKSALDKELATYRPLGVLLDGGAIRGGSSPTSYVIDWEDATDEERGYTLFNSLLALSSEIKPYGLNPMIGNTGKTKNRKGLDQFIPMEWLKNALDKYFVTGVEDVPGKIRLPEEMPLYKIKTTAEFTSKRFTPGEEGEAGHIDKPMTEISPDVLSELVQDSSAVPKLKFPRKGVTSGHKLWIEVANDVYDKLKKGTITEASKKEIDSVTDKSENLTNYLKEIVFSADDNYVSKEEKRELGNVIDSLQHSLEVGNETKYDLAIQRFRDILEGKEQSLDANRLEEGTSSPYSKEDLSESEGIVDFETGVISDTPRLLEKMFKELEELSRQMRTFTSKYKEMLFNPDSETFKKIAAEYMTRVKDLFENKKKRPAAEVEIFNKYFPEFWDSVITLDADRANNAYKEINRIKGFKSGLQYIVPIMMGVRKEIKEQEKMEQKRKEREKKRKKPKIEEQVTVSPEKTEQEKIPGQGQKQEFDKDTYKANKAFLQHQLEIALKQYDMLSYDELNRAAGLGQLMIEAIDNNNIEDYEHMKNKLKQALDDQLERDIFPISDELMTYRQKSPQT